jgi:hypothetical protein
MQTGSILVEGRRGWSLSEFCRTELCAPVGSSAAKTEYLALKKCRLYAFNNSIIEMYPFRI